MIILASSSPRRKQLMSQVTADSFSIYKADINEESSYVLPYKEAVKDIAYRKALEAKKKFPNDIIIAADTIVVIDNKIIGKPKNEADAYNTLKMLSGKTHEVLTSYTIIKNEIIISKIVVSFVTFNSLDDELIYEYIKSGSPLDKAGAYGIQDNDKFPIIKSYKGSMNNIMGFPTDEIKKDLNSVI